MLNNADLDIEGVKYEYGRGWIDGFVHFQPFLFCDDDKTFYVTERLVADLQLCQLATRVALLNLRF